MNKYLIIDEHENQEVINAKNDNEAMFKATLINKIAIDLQLLCEDNEILKKVIEEYFDVLYNTEILLKKEVD